MMHPVRRPRRILDQNPEYDGGKERCRKLDLLDRHGVRFASDQQRNLVDRSEAGKQNGIDAPGKQYVAAEPERTPCQPRDKRPQKHALDNVGGDSGRPGDPKRIIVLGKDRP